MRLRAVLAKGLEATSASVLANEADLDAAGVRVRYEDLIVEMTREAGADGSLREAVGHLLKLTRSCLLAGPVRLLRRGRPAADAQRPGAVLRLVPLPRASGQRSEGDLAGDHGPRLGAADDVGGDPTVPSRWGGSRPIGTGEVASVSRHPVRPTGEPDAETTLPSRPRGIPASD